jgi:predicted histidine transporter YuiF (NhaC family)
MNLSVWARFFAYIGLLTGFLNSIYVMFRKEIEIQKELAEKNKQLDETKAKVEEAYLMLRQEKWDMARSKGSVDKILKDVLKKK